MKEVRVSKTSRILNGTPVFLMSQLHATAQEHFQQYDRITSDVYRITFEQ